jgi:hypothetical protein
VVNDGFGLEEVNDMLLHSWEKSPGMAHNDMPSSKEK